MAKQSQRPRWSNLPSELLLKISHNHLDTHLDFLRFRAICSSWRRSSAPPRRSLLPSNLPYPINHEEFKHRNWESLEYPPIPSGHYILTRSIVYLVQPQQTKPQKIKKPSSTEQGTSWLVKLEEAEQGSQIFRVLSPVSDCQIKNIGFEISLLDFRFIEVSKAYYLKYVNPSQRHAHTFEPCPNPQKVLFFPGVDDEFNVIALTENGRLYYVKKGDEEWTEFNVQIKDIVDYNGRLHSVDSSGCAVHYSSNYEDQNEISDWWKDSISSKRALLENCGRLYSADIELDVDSSPYDYDIDYDKYEEIGGSELRTAVKMKIYCLNEEKHEWEIVNNLGDRILFLGNDCSYSVSATHFGGCKGNVVYHADEGISLQFERNPSEGDDEASDDEPDYWMRDCDFEDYYGYPRNKAYAQVWGAWDDVLKELQGQNIGVFDVDNCKFGSLLMFREGATIFWPPPSWLENNHN